MLNKKTKPERLQSFLCELYEKPMSPTEACLELVLGSDDMPKKKSVSLLVRKPNLKTFSGKLIDVTLVSNGRTKTIG